MGKQYGLILGVALLMACQSTSPPTGKDGTKAMTQLPSTRGEYQKVPLPKSARVDRILISKSESRMWVFSGKTLLKSYKVATGSGGKGHKQVEGDKKTPEGEYFVSGKHASGQFFKFIGVSYPNAKDRRAFKKAMKEKKLPAGSRIGSAIGIHGEKKGWEGKPHKLINWTLGCIAVDNDEIDEIYRAVKPKAKIMILP